MLLFKFFLIGEYLGVFALIDEQYKMHIQLMPSNADRSNDFEPYLYPVKLRPVDFRELS